MQGISNNRCVQELRKSLAPEEEQVSRRENSRGSQMAQLVSS